MTTAYSYIRFSSQEQAKGDSLRRQMELSEQYAKNHNLTLDDSLSFTDIGVSAFRKDNITTGKLGAFLTAIKEGRVLNGSYLLVESLDRLSRDEILSAFGIFTEILNAGITIVTLADQRVYSKQSINDLGNIIYSLTVMSRANEESQTKSKRISAAWENNRARALNGHKISKQCPHWLKLTNGHFEIIEEHAHIMREIFQLTIDGYGQLLLCKHLHETYGKKWHRNSIRQFLNSSAVIGIYAPHKRVNGKKVPLEPIPGYFPPIVSEATFHQAHQAVAERTNRGGKPAGLINIFTALLKCGYCKGTMVRVNRGPSRGRYRIPMVTCNDFRHGLSQCGTQYWPYAELEQSLLADIKEITIEQPKDNKSALDKIRDELSTIDAKITQHNNRIANLVEAIELGNNIKATVERLAILDTELTQLSQERSSMEERYNHESSKSGSINRTIDETNSLIQLIATGGTPIRIKLRQKIGQLVKQIVIKSDKRFYRIDYKEKGWIKKQIVKLGKRSYEYVEEEPPE